MALYTGTLEAEEAVVGGRAGYRLNIGGEKVFLETANWIAAGFTEVGAEPLPEVEPEPLDPETPSTTGPVGSGKKSKQEI